MTRLFVLSPAKTTGTRAGLLVNPAATFGLARGFQSRGLPLSEVFSFTSGLYFRGKLAYATRFARPEGGDLIRIITSNAGLLAPQHQVSVADWHSFGRVDIRAGNPLYEQPLRRDAREFARRFGTEAQVILLGSIATPKYLGVLLEVFGERLLFPEEFVGRGDMSRGSLLLRAARSGVELTYRPVHGAALTGRKARQR